MKNQLHLLTAGLMLFVSTCFASIITQDTVFTCMSSQVSLNLVLPTIDLRDYQSDTATASNFWKSIDGEILVNKHLYTASKKGFYRFELTNIYVVGMGLPSISKDTLTVAVNNYKDLVISIDGTPSVCIGESDKLFYADSALLKKPLVWSNGDTAFHTNMKDANYTVQTQKEDEDKCLVLPIKLPAVKMNCLANSVKDYEEKNAYIVFPNPTSGIITIQKNDATFSQKIFVNDVLGNIVMKVEVDASLNNITIDLSSLKHGCYFISNIEGVNIGKVILN
jgi:hypothetical protein